MPHKNPPATAVRCSSDTAKTKNLSVGLTRPLYSACSEQNHHHATPSPSSATTRTTTTMSTLAPTDSVSSSPFLRLPTELRLHIYALLVLPTRPADLLPSYEKVHASTQDYYDYDRKPPGADPPSTATPTLLIRTLDPDRYRTRYLTPSTSTPNPASRATPLRSKYSVRCARFRSACKSTTYHCLNPPPPPKTPPAPPPPPLQTHLGLLSASARVHAEAAECLYSGYTFDFDTHVEALVPFLQDLTPWARSRVRSIRLVKRALAYEKEFDRCEWRNAWLYLASPGSGVELKRLELGVVAGRPGERGWEGVERYSARDFGVLGGLQGMEWMREVLGVKGLRELRVEAVVEHCAPGGDSVAMAEYIRFSASVEGGFREFMVGEMVGGGGGV
ncbi:hypothetical protein LTR08_008467 [Meristemomyces frigidus]|nr:hypothetical protein LTR08_008467 [Meristemomyces frigidus]